MKVLQNFPYILDVTIFQKKILEKSCGRNFFWSTPVGCITIYHGITLRSDISYVIIGNSLSINVTKLLHQCKVNVDNEISSCVNCNIQFPLVILFTRFSPRLF